MRGFEGSKNREADGRCSTSIDNILQQRLQGEPKGIGRLKADELEVVTSFSHVTLSRTAVSPTGRTHLPAPSRF